LGNRREDWVEMGSVKERGGGREVLLLRLW